VRPPVAVRLLPLLAVLAGASLVLAVGPADADPRGPSVGLSPDGGRYADSLEGPLFSETLRWVPGDRRTASWWVRNESPDTARLAVEVPEDAVLPWWLGVSTRADDGADGGWATVAPDAPGVVGIVAPGEERRVDLRVDMRPGAGNASERESADLRLRVRLTQETPGGAGPEGEGPGGTGPAAPGDGEDPDGLLPGTGSDLGLGLLLLAVLLIGLGAALLRRSRRDEDEPDSEEPATPGPAPAGVTT
jgi:hypothetical protein